MDVRDIFNLYSVSHEYNSPVDRFDRSPAFVQDKFPKMRPVISEYLYQNGFRPTYPDGKEFCVCISHDVDLIYQKKSRLEFANSAKNSFFSRNLRTFIYESKSIFFEIENPSWLLQKIIEKEENLGIVASYYFLALGNGDQDYNYPMEFIQKYSEKILPEGNEIGLHGGHEATLYPDQMKYEKKKLEGVLGVSVSGYRSHYLKFKVPRTWNDLVDAGFSYDTTFGYADLTGYRNGLCYPFRPYDRLSSKFVELIEVPLIAMDVTFWNYMNLGLEMSFEIARKIIDDVQRLNGVFTLLWHNNSFERDQALLYSRILEYLVERDPWFATSNDAARHWRSENLAKMETLLPIQ